MSHSKGSRTERELVRKLAEAGFAVIRAPASGSATARDQPDVLAGDSETFYAIEAKSSADDRIYLDGAEVASLVYFARNFGAKSRIGVRFDEMDWYFFHPDDLHKTDGGNYRVTRETALGEGEDFDSFVGHSEQQRLSTDPDDAQDTTVNEDVIGILQAVKHGELSVEEAASLLE